MREGVLCEVTTDSLDKGLRGIPVGHCFTSELDPNKGIMYDCYPIGELAKKEPLEVIYLLMHGEIGTKPQIQAFKEELAKRSQCKPQTLEHIVEAIHPKVGEPMDVFAMALLIAGMHEGTGKYEEDCLNVIAKLPQIAATVLNCHAGWGITPPSKPELGYVENFLHMLKFPGERKPELLQVMRIFEITHLDHDGGNLSTFVGKAVASGLEHMWGSLAASMTALAGPRHGRANQECLEFVREIAEAMPQATAADLEKHIRGIRKNNGTVFGFGHAVLRVEDPRATIFYNLAKEHFQSHPLTKIALLLRTVAPTVLKEEQKIKNPYPNVDSITGSVLTAAGFDYSDYFTVLFGLSRCVGIATQITDERTILKTPIVRPNYLWQHRSR